MTREECIYYLGKVEYMDANEKEAIDIAIEALQAEVDGDLISRAGVSAWLSNMGHDKLADMVMDEKRFSSAKLKREEAIKILQNPPSAYDEKMWEALDMAIEALSSDVVHCKDCINRWDIIRCPIDDTYTVNDNDYCSFGVRKIKSDIDYNAIRI